MTAVFTGLGAGLAKSSATALGTAGTLGSAATGRAGEGISVNAATGNLLISRRDEFLTGRNLDVGISRTYNSLAQVHDQDNGDNWQMSTTRWVREIKDGGGNITAIERISGDGSVITYLLDASKGAGYWATDGAGAHDTIYKSGAHWVWKEGSSRVFETYEADPYNAGQFRIIKQQDRNNQPIHFGYSGDKLAYVQTTRDGGGNEYVRYTWSGNNLASIQTEFVDSKLNATVTETSTYYTYDANNRLINVKIDLSPDAAGTSDGHSYEISYGYSNNQLVQVSQSDGSRTNIAYDAEGRVTKLTEFVGDGEIRTMRFGYGVNVTSVTDAQGLVTKLWYDNKNQLVQLMSPPTVVGGKSIVKQFDYDEDGNLVRTIETDADNASVPNNLVEASDWGGGEVALRGDNLVNDSGWPQDRDGTLPAAGTVGDGWTSSYIGETEWTKTTGPYGQPVVSLHSGQADNGDAGGGALSQSFAIDKREAYEFSIYVKVDQLDKHRTYFGLGSGVVKNGDTGAYNGNPYFEWNYAGSSRGWTADKWVKIVGYVLPNGDATAPIGSYGGVYDVETGEKVAGIRHFNWDETQSSNSTYMRFFNFYNTERQGKFTHWLRPEVRQVEQAAILRGDQKLDIERDASLFKAPLTDNWYNVGWAANDDEARYNSVVGPDGGKEIALQAGQFDSNDNGGGHYTNNFTIDPSKAYKFTQYFRKDDLDKHSLYFGLSSHGSAYVKTATNGADSTNPYFMALAPATQQSLGMQEGRWYKVVGYVLPEGSANLASNLHGGIFDAETGAKIYETVNFRWSGSRPNDQVHARFFTYYDTLEHGWSTQWMDPEVVELDMADVAADSANPFGIVYDESGLITRYAYDDMGNVIAVTDPSGALTTRTYDTNNNLLTETTYGTGSKVAEFAASSADIRDWGKGGVTFADTTAIDGQPAQILTSAVGATWSATAQGFSAKAGDTVTMTFSVQAVGDATKQAFGLYGSHTGWGASDLADVKIISGPGKIVYRSGAYAHVDGLSTTEATRIQVTRTYLKDESAGGYLYVDLPQGWRDGAQVIYSAPEVAILRRDQTVSSPTDIAQWGKGGIDAVASGTLNGEPAQKLTSSAGANWSGTSSHVAVEAGDEVVFDMTLQAVTGSSTTQSLGLYGSVTGWNGSAISSARILSGPGTITQLVGGLWTISGLSTSQATRIQVRRTYEQAETAGGYLYVDHPGGYRDGEALLAAAPRITHLKPDSTPALTTRFAYNANGALRYSVSADGRVREYIYDSIGRLIYERDFSDALYVHPKGSNAPITEAELTAWRDASADKSGRIYKRYKYDGRGNLEWTLKYGGADAAGNADSANGYGYSYTYFDYDQEGRLLSRHKSGENGKEKFVYDGMGRLIASTDASGSMTSVFFNDANSRTVMQMASGLTRTMVYNKSGDLVSETESSLGVYGANLATAPTGWWKGDVDVAQSGTLNGATAYAVSVNTANPSATHIAQGAGSYADDETVRFKVTLQGDGANDLRVGLWGNVSSYGDASFETAQAIIVDGPGRLVRTHGAMWRIEGVSATETTTVEITRIVDVAQGMSAVVGFADNNVAQGATFKLAAPVITSVKTDPSLSFAAETQDTFDRLGRVRMTQDAFDSRGPSYFIYDNAGRKVGVVDPAGGLTEYFYDTQNRVTGTVSYTNAVSTVVRDQLANPDNTLEMTDVRPTSHGYDVREWTTYDRNGRVAQSINGEGEVVSFDYDMAGRLIEQRAHATKLVVPATWNTAPPIAPVLHDAHADDAVTRTFYDRDGNVRGVLDGEGYLSESEYDSAGRRVREVAYGTRVAASLRATGSLSALVASLPSGANDLRQTRYVYDGRGNLRYQIDNANYVTAFEYNAANKLTRTTSHINPLSGTHSDWTYLGVKASVLGSSSDRLSLNYYDTFGRLYRTYDNVSLNTYFYYDNAGNLTKTVVGTRETRNWYDARGNLRFTVDPENYVTAFLYNTGGQVTHVKRYNATVSVDDDTTIQGLAGMIVDTPSTTRTEYDSSGRVYRQIDAVGSITSYFYRYNGQLAWTNVADGTTDLAQTTFYYDNAGRLIRQGNADGQSEESIVSNAFDGLGRQSSVTDGEGRTTSFTYDKRGLVLTETNALDHTIRYEYNAYGEVVKTWDANASPGYPNNPTSETSYTNRGQLEWTKDALGNQTSYTYTHFGEVQQVTDARGAVTSFEYDKLGRVKKTTDALGHFETYTYNIYSERLTVVGKSSTSSTVAGSTTTYAYDDLGRVIRVTDANGYQTATDYDSRSNVIETRQEVTAGSAESSWLKTTFEYDSANRLTKKIVPSAHGYIGTTSYAYDGRGNLTRETAPDGGRTVYFYDDLDRVTIEVSPVGTLTRYAYDKVGNVTNIKVYETPITVPANGAAEEMAPPEAQTPAGVYRETSFEFDAANRMERSIVIGVHNGTASGTTWSADAADFVTQYEYDANGNVVKTIDPEGNATFAWYDKLNRKQHQVDGSHYRTTWVYDAVGNVTRESRYANTTNAAPAVGVHPALSSSSDDRHTDYTYDLVGNRLTESRRNVKFHNGSGGHTTSNATTNPNPVVTYEYNGLGQVILKKEAETGNDKAFEYDAGGRLELEYLANPITSTTGGSEGFNVRPATAYEYDGLGNLTQTRQGSFTENTSLDRYTKYGYENGLLRWVQDAEFVASGGARGKQTSYWYDSSGRIKIEYAQRRDSSGAVAKLSDGRTITYSGMRYSYDLAGRKTQEWMSVYVPNASGNLAWEDVGPRTTTSYNAFGDVSSVKVGNGAEQKNVYDLAGRMVATNSGDGVWKHFGYDKNGNQTIAITSAGAAFTQSTTFQQAFDQIGNANVNATYTEYDARNMAVKVTEEQRELSSNNTQDLVTERKYNAFGEVEWEEDAADARINYTYNTAGKVIKVESPSVSITNEDGSTATVRPTEHMYYDKSGRLVAQRDANGNLTRMEYLAGTGFDGGQGLVTKTIYADGETETRYDRFGDARQTIDQIGRVTNQTFDKMGRVIQVNHASGLIDKFTYDGNGQRLSHENNVYGVGNKATTDYDALGRVTKSRAFGGDITSIGYTWNESSLTNAVGNFGGWQQVTTMANGRQLTERSDIFGRQTYKNDLGGHVTTSTYDAAGRLEKSEIGTSSYNYEYYNTGQISRAYTAATGFTYFYEPEIGLYYTTTNAVEHGATYTYDVAGNRLTEYGTTTIGGSVTAVWKNHSATYDALGRTTSITSGATGTNPAASTTWTYDANGNIRSKKASFFYLNSDGTAATHDPSNREYWYRYDTMNRVVLDEGVLSGAAGASGTTIVRSNVGTAYTYDAAGQRMTSTSYAYLKQRGWRYTNNQGIQSWYEQREDLWGGSWQIADYTYYGTQTEHYEYDDGGRVKTVNIAQQDVNFGWGGPVTLGGMGAAIKRSEFNYDLMGRQTMQKDYARTQSGVTAATTGAVISHITNTYNGKGQVSNSYSATLKSDNKSYTSTTTNNFGSGSGYALGSVVSSTSVNGVTGESNKTSSTANTFTWWDGAQQNSITYDADTGSSSNTIHTTNFTYNGLGQMTKAQINDGLSRSVTFSLDEIGQIIRRDETRPSNAPSHQQGSPHEIWYRFGDREFGYTGNNGSTKQMSYEEAILDKQYKAASNQGTFRGGRTGSVNAIDFAQGPDKINAYGQGSRASSSYTVRSGDTLQSVAQRLYGDASLWYKIAEVNGLSGGSSLVGGTNLVLPSGVVRSTNNVNTFSPYDPASAIGDLSPTAPKPTKGNKCGVFGAILLTVIAVAVATIVTAGAASAISGQAFGAVLGAMTGGAAVSGVGMGAWIAGGAIGGAIGSMASQGVGVATGIQEKFSWKSVAMAGIQGAIGGVFQGLGNAQQLAIDKATKGLSGVAKLQAAETAKFTGVKGFLTRGGLTSGAARGLISNVATQGIGTATGLQDKFNWAGVASATVGGGVGSWVGGKLGKGFGAKFTASMASSFANAATRSAIEGSSFGANIKAAIPDVIGQALGDAIVGALPSVLRNIQAARIYADLDPVRKAPEARSLVKTGLRIGLDISELKEIVGQAIAEGNLSGTSLADISPYSTMAGPATTRRSLRADEKNRIAAHALGVFGNPEIIRNTSIEEAKQYVRSLSLIQGSKTLNQVWGNKDTVIKRATGLMFERILAGSVVEFPLEFVKYIEDNRSVLSYFQKEHAIPFRTKELFGLAEAYRRGDVGRVGLRVGLAISSKAYEAFKSTGRLQATTQAAWGGTLSVGTYSGYRSRGHRWALFDEIRSNTLGFGAERAALKGLRGIRRTPNGGITYARSPSLVKLPDGTPISRRIKLTGDYSEDRMAMIDAFGLHAIFTPQGGMNNRYVFHHVDDLDSQGRATIQLVFKQAHAGLLHRGGVAQWEARYGRKYQR